MHVYLKFPRQCGFRRPESALSWQQDPQLAGQLDAHLTSSLSSGEEHPASGAWAGAVTSSRHWVRLSCSTLRATWVSGSTS